MNNLEKLLSLRYDIQEREYEIKETMPLAINEALENISHSNNQVVLRQKGKGKIILQYRKKYPTIKSDSELAKLDELITASTQDLIYAKRQQLNEIDRQIEEHQEAIKRLQEERNNLLTNKRIVQLKTRFIEVRENSMYLDPNLSIYLS